MNRIRRLLSYYYYYNNNKFYSLLLFQLLLVLVAVELAVEFQLQTDFSVNDYDGAISVILVVYVLLTVVVLADYHGENQKSFFNPPPTPPDKPIDHYTQYDRFGWEWKLDYTLIERNQLDHRHRPIPSMNDRFYYRPLEPLTPTYHTLEIKILAVTVVYGVLTFFISRF